ncbi:hypothetical protein SISSUDRAFT_1030854 [Sistotremastrum suecicum HHB10207 ss-3]|uniref:AB hydrolase-1 domain-containing protein n=1 Tax=Sistotremastrum suecicum HHB10207 ss-3 TaxID=1314776 RepID=A0A166GQ97_9AGAM|nr:hypothetical protein SISSUDRAFT_1030854 [Sistotremastrum suecicum HHB10207 ss-3]
MSWHCETYVVDSRPSYHYRVMGNRYTPKVPRDNSQSRVGKDKHISLIFLHATSMFKECFEPVIDLLFTGYSSRSGKSPVIDEVWSIECPNHGYSAVLNADDIRIHNPETWQTHEYADAAYAFLRGRPGGHDLPKKNLVIIGHSMGAFMMPYLTQREPKIEFDAIILCDPIISPRCREMDIIEKVWVKSTFSHRDTWTSRVEAREYLDRYKVWKIWTSDIKDLFVGGEMPDSHPLGGAVKLAFSKEHEISTYRTSVADDTAHNELASLYASNTPVHLVYDMNPHPIVGKVQGTLHRCHGFEPTSAQPIRSGHMFFQTNPIEGAELIMTALEYERNPHNDITVARL